MNEVAVNSATIGVVISLLTYEIGWTLRARLKLNVLNPLLVSIILTILFLSVSHISYKSYAASAQYLSYLLTPATVCLAIPLYRQIELLKRDYAAILLALLAGALTSMGTVLILSLLFGLTHEQYVTLLPKSITTAIGMGVSEELGGYVTISVASIIMTGVIGNMSAEFACRLFRLKSGVARGLAIGAASHAIGTSKAMLMGEVEGAMSSLAIVVSGVITVIGASFFAGLY